MRHAPVRTPGSEMRAGMVTGQLRVAGHSSLWSRSNPLDRLPLF